MALVSRDPSQHQSRLQCRWSGPDHTGEGGGPSASLPKVLYAVTKGHLGLQVRVVFPQTQLSTLRRRREMLQDRVQAGLTEKLLQKSDPSHHGLVMLPPSSYQALLRSRGAQTTRPCPCRGKKKEKGGEKTPRLLCHRLPGSLPAGFGGGGSAVQDQAGAFKDSIGLCVPPKRSDNAHGPSGQKTRREPHGEMANEFGGLASPARNPGQ